MCFCYVACISKVRVDMAARSLSSGVASIELELAISSIRNIVVTKYTCVTVSTQRLVYHATLLLFLVAPPHQRYTQGCRRKPPALPMLSSSTVLQLLNHFLFPSLFILHTSALPETPSGKSLPTLPHFDIKADPRSITSDLNTNHNFTNTYHNP